MPETAEKPHSSIVPTCPFCGSTEFIEFKGRPHEKCEACRVPSRVRSNWVLLEHAAKLSEASKVAHFAPEHLLALKLKAICGDNYFPYDLVNERYDFGFPVGKIDMCHDLDTLPKGFYDVVLHTHVLEHVPCNYTVVLPKLHALLKPGGLHVFSFPIGAGSFREDQSPLVPRGQRKVHYGQQDHVRRFGTYDFAAMVGCIFGIGEDYSLTDFVPEEKLIAAAIPKERWTLELGPVFAVRKV